MQAHPRRALAAPDKFKGTFSAAEVAAALARGARAAGWEPRERPIADGGEGTADALLTARGGEWIEADAHDALGRPVRARFALLADGRTAVVEVAAASGLWRIDEHERDARAASTRGTGELIAAAVAHGAETVVVGAGGSATSDGGRGAIDALAALGRSPRIVVACDTELPFEAAAEVYGPQKGATPADVRALAHALDAFAAAAPRDPRGLARGGAAGGLAGGLWAHCDAELVAGAAYVMESLGMDDEIADADAVLTGEGCIDAQTLTGKAVGVLAARCARAGVPIAAVVGCDALASGEREQLGLAAVREAGELDAIARAATELLATLA